VTLWYRPPDVLLGATKYSTQVDIWGVGCIFAEMVNGRPLFCGQNDRDQIDRIFKVLGTPNQDTWPEVNKLPLWRKDFPQYDGKGLRSVVPRLSEQGLDLLAKMLGPNPAKRISAKDAMAHPYFDELRQAEPAF